MNTLYNILFICTWWIWSWMSLRLLVYGSRKFSGILSKNWPLEGFGHRAPVTSKTGGEWIVEFGEGCLWAGTVTRVVLSFFSTQYLHRTQFFFRQPFFRSHIFWTNNFFCRLNMFFDTNIFYQFLSFLWTPNKFQTQNCIRTWYYQQPAGTRLMNW